MTEVYNDSNNDSALGRYVEKVTAVDKISRRDFLIKLTVGSLAISGFFLGADMIAADSVELENKGASAGKNFFPRLRDGAVITEGSEVVSVRLAEGDNSSLCAVNQTGGEIIKMLNGENSIEMIGSVLARKMKINMSSGLNAKIAIFIAHLAANGFLQDDFYVTIYENSV